MNRPPIVTVLGHVDHGKTSLLDALRGTNVASGESGGITQHTGASQITHNGKKITFIDTPGHEAFSEMRSRGGKAADIAILVVAANDGVKPQTKEAITHIKSASIPYIVALNKIDLEGVVVDKVKSQLHKEGVLLEEYGGDVMCLEVSATKKKNLDKLLDSIILLSEIIDVVDEPSSELSGFVLESRHDPKKGNVANVILTSGSLEIGEDLAIGGSQSFRVKSLVDYKGDRVKRAVAGDPVEILGLNDTAMPGEIISVFKNQEITSTAAPKETEDALKEGLKVVLRADTKGTLEALSSSISKLEYEGKGVEFILKDVGDIKESDILLASTSNSLVVSFNTKIPPKVKERAEQLGVLTIEYDIIYKLLEDLQGALEGVFEIEEDKVKGRAEVLKTFPLPSGDVVAGCYVTHGRLRENDNVSVRLEGEEQFKSKIKKLKKANAGINLVGKDTECGVLLVNNHEKLQQGLTIEVL